MMDVNAINHAQRFSAEPPPITTPPNAAAVQESSPNTEPNPNAQGEPPPITTPVNLNATQQSGSSSQSEPGVPDAVIRSRFIPSAV